MHTSFFKLQSLARENLSSNSYGAVGDGVTDEWANWFSVNHCLVACSIGSFFSGFFVLSRAAALAPANATRHDAGRCTSRLIMDVSPHRRKWTSHPEIYIS